MNPLNRSRRAAAARPTSPRGGRGQHLAVERLEARDVPTVILPGPNTPGAVVLTGTAGPDQLVIRTAPTLGIFQTFQFSDDGGKTFHSAPAHHVTAVFVNGKTGSDRLTIDHSLGFVAKAEGLPISYQAGSSFGSGWGFGREFDQLVLMGDPGAGVHEVFTAIGSRGEGQLLSTNGYRTQTVKFSPLASILDTVAAESLTVNGTAGSDAIKLLNGAKAGDLATTRVVVSAPGAQASATPLSVDFANKPVLNVDGKEGDDVFTVDNPVGATGLQSIGLIGGGGFDGAVHVNDPPGVAMWHDGIEWIKKDQKPQ